MGSKQINSNSIASKLDSKRRIRLELRMKGIDRELIDTNACQITYWFNILSRKH